MTLLPVQVVNGDQIFVNPDYIIKLTPHPRGAHMQLHDGKCSQLIDEASIALIVNYVRRTNANLTDVLA